MAESYTIIEHLTTSHIILDYLKGHSEYLHRFPENRQAVYFEYLVARAFSGILHLPFYTADTNDRAGEHRVVWLGSADSISRARPGPDAIAYACGYSILIEPTLKTGTTQWTQEFGPCCDHYERFVVQKNVNPTDAYLVMIAPRVHARTWESTRAVEANIVIANLAGLAAILETSTLACAMKHIELRELLNDLRECLRHSTSLAGYVARANDCVGAWQRDVLQRERITFVALKSYEALRMAAREGLSSGEIFQFLQREPTVQHYTDASGGHLPSTTEIEEDLLQLSLGHVVGRTSKGERLFCPVPVADYKNRAKRLVEMVEEIDGRFK